MWIVFGNHDQKKRVCVLDEADNKQTWPKRKQNHQNVYSVRF